MMLIAFFNWGSFLAWMIWTLLYFQNYKGLTPLQTAIILLPMFFSGIVCNIFVVIMAARIALVWMLGIGTVATTVACLLFAIIDPDATYWAFAFPAIFLSSMGADIISSVGTLFIAKVVQPHEQSVAGGLFVTMTQVGSAVGVTVSTVVANAVVAQDMSDRMSIYRVAQGTAFIFGVFGRFMTFTNRVGVMIFLCS
jgi:nitrate/nitrite transporter NarK